MPRVTRIRRQGRHHRRTAVRILTRLPYRATSQKYERDRITFYPICFVSLTIKRTVMKKPFRWLIIQYAQTKLDVKNWHKHMIPVLMKMEQYRHVEIDLIYCPASRRPERAKWGKGMHSWIFYHFGPNMEGPRTHHVPRQSFASHPSVKRSANKTAPILRWFYVWWS